MRHLPPALLACCALSGCFQIFAPSVDPEITKHLGEANQSLTQIVACVELGTCDGRASYSKVEDDYVKAFAAVNTAKRRAEQIDPATGKAPDAKDLFVAEIQRCEDAIKEMHDAHRRFSSIREAGLTQPTLLTCDIPLASAKALS